MTDTDPAVEDRQLETLTLVLRSPIPGPGGEVREITLTEPTAAKTAAALRSGADKGDAALIAECAGLPVASVGKLKISASAKISRWLKDLNVSALASDGDRDLEEEERTFDLLVPFSYDGRRIERVTATEPDLDAVTAAAKAGSPGDVTIALVAAVIGEPRKVVTRMAWRDVARIEAWLAPFVTEGAAG